MCRFYPESNERMESTDNELLGLYNGVDVGSSTLHSPNPEQGRSIQQVVSSPPEAPLTSPIISLTNSDSVASNFSEYSVDASPHNGHSEIDGGTKRGQDDLESKSPNGHVTDANLGAADIAIHQLGDLKESHQTGKNESVDGNLELSSDDANNDDSEDTDEALDEADEQSPAYDDQDGIWIPPEAENEDDNKEHSVATLDDEDDECANGDGSEWAMPSSLNSFEEGIRSGYRFKEEKQKAMEEVMNGKFKNLVSQLLRKVGVDNCFEKEESWVDTITLLAWQSASFVKPEAADGKAMDPAGYVKIKCIATGSRSDSRLIKGLVFKKHAAHKHMATRYKNPRLLLVQGTLEPSDSSGLSSFNSMISESKVNVTDHLLENLKACNPNVILVEKSASRDVLQKVLDLGVTLVLDMKLHRLERVARCTSSPILSSDKPFGQKLKLCDSLYFEKIVEDHAVEEGGKKPCKTLMFVEGCPTRLGCTILLKGSQSEELKKVKCVLQCAVVMAYHFLLETSFLVDQRAMFSTICNEVDILSSDEQSISAYTEPSNISHIEDPNVDVPSAVVHVPISGGVDDEPSPVEESASKIAMPSDLDNQIPCGLHDEESNESSHFKETAPEAAEATTSNGSHVRSLSIASSPSSSIHDVLQRVSLVSPATFEGMTSYMNLNGREDDAHTAVSIPVSHTEEGGEPYNLAAMNSSKDCMSRHNPSDSLSSLPAAADEVKGAVDGEDCIRTKEEISNVLDSESILVLKSSRNASKSTICEQIHFSQIKFYRNFDIPLGKFLRDTIFNQTVPCKTCSELPEAHYYYYAHHNKQLTIRVRRLSDKMRLPGESEGKLWMWSRCGKCPPNKEKATKRVLISTAARGLSFGKFLELSFSSHSSLNRLSSCGHSFQKDFLYFFGLGSMVAMFHYSRVATYTVSVPAQKLEFDSSISTDWLQHEIETVYTKGLLLFSEIANYLKKIEPRFSGQILTLHGLTKAFAEIVDMLKLEKSEFEESIKNTGIKDENAHNTVHKLLILNRLRWEILLEACVWDRRLQSLLSSSSTRPHSSVTNDITQTQMDMKEDGSAGTAGDEAQGPQSPSEEVLQGLTVLEDHKSTNEGEERREVAEEELVDVEKDQTEGAVTAITNVTEGQIGLKDCSAGKCQGEQRDPEIGQPNTETDAKEIAPVGDDNSFKLFNDAEVHIETDAGVQELTITEFPQEGAVQGCGKQDRIDLPIVEDNLQGLDSGHCSPMLPESDKSTKFSVADNISSSDSLSEDRNIPIIGGEEEKSNSSDKEVAEILASPPQSIADARLWVWNSFSHIRDECLEALQNGCLPKVGHLPKFVLLHSPDFLPTISEVITDEGERLHIPLTDSDYIVSDFEGEISSSVACALALLKDLTPIASDSEENATLKRATSEPSGWAMSGSFDPDVIHSATSMSFAESRFPSVDGLNHLNSLVSYGQVHPEVTLGVEKYPVRGKYSVVIIYANEFRAFREQCCPSELDFISSLSRCKIWDAKGGKSKSLFAKTLDDRLIIKEIKKTELESFLKFATEYFKYMKQSVNSGNQTCLAKILGIYQVTVRHPKNGKETKHDLMVMENLSFGRNITRQYDLKGALHARFTATADGAGDVLLDQNFVIDMNASPLYVGQRAKRLLQRAVWNDTTFLHSINVMDYSLLVGVDRKRHELVCGIIDYLRQYTWDKQFETWVKSSLVVPKNVSPTIISPEQYKKRFRKFMDTHFLTVPDHWCSQRSSNPCKLCGVKPTNGSVVRKLEMREGEPNGSCAHD